MNASPRKTMRIVSFIWLVVFFDFFEGGILIELYIYKQLNIAFLYSRKESLLSLFFQIEIRTQACKISFNYAQKSSKHCNELAAQDLLAEILLLWCYSCELTNKSHKQTIKNM